MLRWILFAVASLTYFIAAATAMRAAMVHGHRGDQSLPVTMAFAIVAASLWVASLILLPTIGLPDLA